LAIRHAAAEITFERTHAERGDGWWGHAPLMSEDQVFKRIQVWPSVLPAAADQGVVFSDHAGYYETSLLLAAHPELVEMERLGMDAPWYCTTNNRKSREASVESGEQMWQAMVNAWVEDISSLTRSKRPSPGDVTITGIF
jgi:creatinine amidohydrolase/Fe(II)-dependent formamide hydrolase-like protein